MATKEEKKLMKRLVDYKSTLYFQILGVRQRQAKIVTSNDKPLDDEKFASLEKHIKSINESFNRAKQARLGLQNENKDV